MAEPRVQRRLAAILAADVVGYSRLMEIDEAGTLARLQSLRREIVDPAIADRAAELLPNGRLLEFSESGHAPFLEEREKFNRELLAFLQDPAR